ncbi:MAG: hypothetical protein EOM20_15985 [Spartobacteria bacterium]|nr:hypothetical protein [Spartobacteria bacterium]
MSRKGPLTEAISRNGLSKVFNLLLHTDVRSDICVQQFLTCGMGWGRVLLMNIESFFHHPDVSFTVVRRHCADAFLDMLWWYGEILLTSGRRLKWGECFSSDSAYRSAVSRLRKSGVIAGHPDVGKGRFLNAYDDRLYQENRLSHPDRYWGRRWNQYWHVLVYDIPEKEASLRRSLRTFMRNLHMGCLQRSVWVTPDDIRPAYEDLVHAIQIQFESYLFEATTVLGRSQQDIVLNAWDFNRLGEQFRWYQHVCEHNLNVLRQKRLTLDVLKQMAYEEMSAYHTAMANDPFLPNALLPDGYQGRKVFSLHKRFVETLKMQMKESK